MMGELINLEEYLKIKRNLEREGKPVNDLTEKIKRIRESIARLDALAKELRGEK
jgi:hypothetical protein